MKNLLILLGLLISGALSAQQWGEIHGTVKDELGTPLPNAYVVAEAGDNQFGVATDLDGKFKLKPLNSGVYTIKVSFVGMANYVLTGVKVDPDKITFLDKIAMGENPVMIDKAVIEAFQNDLIERDGVTIATIRSEELEHSPVKRDIKGIISTMTPAVYVDPTTQELHFRGARAGTVITFVDGMKVTGNFGGIPASGIGSVSVYTGGVPAKYGDTTGGVVVIESKNYFDLYNEWLYSQE
ncbi:MAG: Plug and carboxypeptidase regulatory-like domain-containing protein [Flavobacteriales bacterium]|nr:Plug and carboxypeptidase regulatory-like domain-containing protein [Flavobacteriales bacterium]